MLPVFWLFLLCLNLILGYQKRSLRFIQLITLLIIMVLMCGNSEGPDITGLIYVYSHPDAIEYNDIGYDALCVLFRDYLNIDFYYFRFIVTTAFMLMLWNTLNFYKVNIHLFLALYMCYLFFIDTIQNRNMFAMITITFTSRYLIDSNKKNNIKFVLITLLVSTIHVITLTNLLYLLAKYMKRKLAIYTFAGLGSLIALLSLIAKSMGGNMMLMISSMFLPKESRVDGYFETETRFSGPALGFLAIWAIVLCYKAAKRLKNLELDEKTRKLVDIVLLCSLVTLIFIGTLLLNVSFYRFFRNLLLLQFMVMILWLNSYKVKAQKRFINFLSVLGLSVMWFVIDVCLIETYEVCVTPVFEHNFLWE